MLAVEGGTIANVYAVLVARHSARPEVKAEGLANLPPLVVFQSDRVRFFFNLLLTFNLTNMFLAVPVICAVRSADSFERLGVC